MLVIRRSNQGTHDLYHHQLDGILTWYGRVTQNSEGRMKKKHT